MLDMRRVSVRLGEGHGGKAGPRRQSSLVEQVGVGIRGVR